MGLPEVRVDEGRSVCGRVWRLADRAFREASVLVQQAGLHPTVARILAERGHVTPELAGAFLNPRLEMLPPPFELKDMDVAVERLVGALECGDKMAVFGDYDVDGTCATAMLVRYFRALGVEVEVYIPHRLTEGYGPTPAAMRDLAGRGVKLLLTVDTGTTAHAALEEAANLGMDVIVTDHHQPEATLPPAKALLNPQRRDDTSSLQGLCGSGVAFYLLMALNKVLREKGWFAAGRKEPSLVKLLDLVALATVADVMPLTGVNRVLVARGLLQMGTWQNRGLAMLADVGALKTKPDTYAAGFVLGPRLNAAGRVDSAQAAVQLLLADEDKLAIPLAHTLDRLNAQRKEMEKKALDEAMLQADALGWADAPALVLAGDWHPGIVGIVAARVKERTQRVVVVLGKGGDGFFKGSGRSVPALNLGQAVHACASLLVSGGGHAMAAGMTLEAGKLEAFRDALNMALWAQLEAAGLAGIPLDDVLVPPLDVDASLMPASLTPALVEQLGQLAPFGPGHPEPMLALTGAVVAFSRPVGAAQEHVKLRLSDVGKASMVDAMAFGAGKTPLGPALTNRAGRPLTVAGHVRVNTWNGATNLDFHIVDAHEGWRE